ncbi:MAG: ComEC/Rec2 family competence protein [Candidatus Peregrinibacteria bacterium]|nr:ComEC/Rec2 family competence protein [Candidatus Peregrinibacteria bacterium]
MRASRISIAFLVSFLLTTFSLQWWQERSYPLIVWISLGTAFALTLGGILTRRTERWILYLACVIGISLAFADVARTTHTPGEHAVEHFALGEFVTVNGRIIGEPDQRTLATQYTLEASDVKNRSGATIPAEGRVLVVDRGGGFDYGLGDRVSAAGILEKPEPVEDFRYDLYLSEQGIYALISRASVTREEKAMWSVRSSLSSLRASIEDRIDQLYPEPHASLLAGLLTGARSGLPTDLEEAFRRAGVMHIIAVSGYNITLVITAVFAMLFWLPLKWRVVPGAIAIVLFVLLVGASASAVRAAIMGILGCIALALGRETHARLGILWTAFAMVAWNPKELWYDAGFALSFLAVIGISEFQGICTKLCGRFPRALGIRDSLTMTCCAQITAVPWSLALFHSLSVIAPLSNILVAPLIPISMLVGSLSLVVSVLSPPLGQLIAFVGWGCLSLIISGIALLAKVPFASVDMPIGRTAITVYYLFLLFMIIRRDRLQSATLTTGTGESSSPSAPRGRAPPARVPSRESGTYRKSPSSRAGALRRTSARALRGARASGRGRGRSHHGDLP